MCSCYRWSSLCGRSAVAGEAKPDYSKFVSIVESVGSIRNPWVAIVTATFITLLLLVIAAWHFGGATGSELIRLIWAALVCTVGIALVGLVRLEVYENQGQAQGTAQLSDAGGNKKAAGSTEDADRGG